MTELPRGPSRSLSDSEMVSGCKHSSPASRPPFVEEMSCESGAAGSRLWLLLSQPPPSDVVVVFIANQKETPAEDVVVRETLVMLTVPVLLSSGDCQVSLRSESQQHQVTLPFSYTSTPKESNGVASVQPLLAFATSGDSLSLLSPFTALIGDVDEDNNTVLHVTARNGQSYALKLFLCALQNESEARRREVVNARNVRGQTALHCAVRADDADAVHYLLSAGAQLTLLDSHSNSVLHYLADSHNEAIYKEILERPLAKEHLEKSTDEGYTPLHLAVRRLKLSLLEMLADVEADVNARDGKGRTPLMHAVDMNDADIVAFLLSKGSDPNVEDGDGETPLLLANKVANMVVLGLLLDAGADPRMQTKSGASLVDVDNDQVRRIIAGERIPQIFKEDGLVKYRAELFGKSSGVGGGEGRRGEEDEEGGEVDEEVEGEEGEEERTHTDEGEDDGPSTSTGRGSRGGSRRTGKHNSAFSKDDISCLDYLTRLRLSKILDDASKWESLARELECSHMVELISICAFDSSPTMIFLDQFEQLPDAKISRVRAALERLNEQQAVDLIEQRFVY